jgi:nucleotide-binding universal stress UspA family protein
VSAQTDQVGPVIVGVDGSDRSADALALAGLLAPALGAPILIAFVHHYGWLSSIFSDDEAEQRLRLVAESTLDKVRETLPSTPDRKMRLVAHDSAAAGLHVLAEREGAALIVIGSSHRSRLGRILPGGTGERLLSGAPAPVAIAPRGYATSERRLQRVGCGYDATPESRHALVWAEMLARATSTHLHLISVHEQRLPATLAVGGSLATSSLNDILRRERLDELNQALSEAGDDLDVSAELLEGRAMTDLARTSDEVDLLVVGSRGYGPVRAVLLGSVSRELVRSAKSPLVVIPRPNVSAARQDASAVETHV